MLAGVIAIGAVTFPTTAATVTRAAHRSATVPATSCASRWYRSSRGTHAWTLLRTDPSGLPLSSLVFRPSFSDPTDSAHGFLDFNHDGKSDVFATKKLANGTYQWLYSPGGTHAWVKLAARKTPPANLRFGDFNADGVTDVFFTTTRSDGDLQWNYAPGGMAPFVQLAHDATPLADLRFGDFDGNGFTDVFSTVVINQFGLRWRVSWAGITDWFNLASASTTLKDMVFADVNGDGHTDVVTQEPGSSAGLWVWMYASGGSDSYQNVIERTQSMAHTRLAGDFNTATNGIGTDWFYTTKRSDGAFQWWYFHYHAIPYTVGDTKLWHDFTPPAQLRFADFNGDRVADVFKLTRTC